VVTQQAAQREASICGEEVTTIVVLFDRLVVRQIQHLAPGRRQITGAELTRVIKADVVRQRHQTSALKADGLNVGAGAEESIGITAREIQRDVKPGGRRSFAEIIHLIHELQPAFAITEAEVEYRIEAAVTEACGKSGSAFIGVVNGGSVRAHQTHLVVREHAIGDFRREPSWAPGMQIEGVERRMVTLHRVRRSRHLRAVVARSAEIPEAGRRGRSDGRPGGRIERQLGQGGCREVAVQKLFAVGRDAGEIGAELGISHTIAAATGAFHRVNVHDSATRGFVQYVFAKEHGVRQLLIAVRNRVGEGSGFQVQHRERTASRALCHHRQAARVFRPHGRVNHVVVRRRQTAQLASIVCVENNQRAYARRKKLHHRHASAIGRQHRAHEARLVRQPARAASC
jgi:hypothetical protein